MMQERTRYWVLFGLSIAGVVIAAMAGLVEHVPWLDAMCTGFSDGCRETARFTVLRVPIWSWGIAFYVILAVTIFRAKHWLFWLAGIAIGIEAALVWVMISTKVVCVFCIGNALVVLLLVVFAFDKTRFWQMLSAGLAVFLISMLLIPQENKLFGFSASRQDSSAIVAKVDGEVVTQEELMRPLASSVYDLQMNIYKLKKQRLDQMISDILLKKDAQKRGVTVQQLVNDTILAGGTSVDESEVNRYYEENQARLAEWKGSHEELMERIRVYLQQQKSYKKVTDYTAALAGEYGVTNYLREPLSPVTTIKTQGAAVLGPADAPVTVVEFSDYRCPACRSVHPTVRQVRQFFNGRLRWVFVDYPLERHKDAEIAAEAGRCAAEQHKFWEYQDILYGSEEEFTPERLEDFAQGLGMDRDAFKQCLESRKYTDPIEKDIEEAKSVGVDRTPTFLVNGKMLVGGRSFEHFKEVIESELPKESKK